MPRKPKTFGDLLKQSRKSQSSKSSTSQFIVEKAQSIKETEIAPTSDFEAQEKRIGKIVGLNEEGEVREVKIETLTIYWHYLQENIKLPCLLTGIEDFSWEEYYVIGNGSKKEHERLRKTKPSYLDIYELSEWKSSVQEDPSLIVCVKRQSDRKKLFLILDTLKAVDENSCILSTAQ
ncbi:MAG: hypothetical protein F6K22_02560 [Okeania sp. SIO2F4]|uniref:hypothetical protein n=1 Tax=Okeania sp. SIO2F4 TaxID=2607790 RepID=UPI00142B3D44|nr:hypothetical protein [Okeania sp. SIO2F4]NES01805.1 hypothetical protein [Okeania sp. SIO2F4]